MNIVTLEQVKAHLDLDHGASDDMLETLRGDVSEIIVDYIKANGKALTFNGKVLDITEWNDRLGEPIKAKIPGAIRAAALQAIAATFENRDGSQPGRLANPQIISQNVIDLLARMRDPAMA